MQWMQTSGHKVRPLLKNPRPRPLVALDRRHERRDPNQGFGSVCVRVLFSANYNPGYNWILSNFKKFNFRVTEKTEHDQFFMVAVSECS